MGHYRHAEHGISRGSGKLIYKKGAHSALRLSTGFTIAALSVLIHRITSAISKRLPPPAAKIHQLIEVLYAKFSSHLRLPHQEMGTAMKIARAMSLRKSRERRMIRLATLA